MSQQLLITVHGVGRSDDWQSRVQNVFEPFFDYRPIRYPQYDTSPAKAVLRVVVQPLALLLSIVLFGLQAFLHFMFGRHSGLLPAYAYLPVALAVLILSIGIYLAYRRRNQAYTAVRDELNRMLAGCRSANLIAHSLGTYLTCRALSKVVGLKLRRVIFVGSVVRRRFAWDTYVGGLRNEVGADDFVVVLAGFAKFLVWMLGWAGWRGFKGSPAVVHHCQTSNVCIPCFLGPATAVVHNTKCPYSHNDHFLGPFHAFQYWIPFLWECDPVIFETFLHRCQDALVKAEQGAEAELRQRIEDLLYASWGGKYCMGQLVVNELRARLKLPPDEYPEPDKVFEIATHAWNSIVLAQKAIEDPDYPDRGKLVRSYNPVAAIDDAIEAIYP